MTATVLAAVLPQLVGNDGLRTLRSAIADPLRWAIEPKVDGVRGLIVYEDGCVTARNRRGQVRDWFRFRPFHEGLVALGEHLPILWRGTVLDGELMTGRFATTMAALQGSARYGPDLRLVVFDVPVLAGVDLRDEPWDSRRERLELLGRAFAYPFELSPVIPPSVGLVTEMEQGRLEGIVLKDRRSPYRDGSRARWAKVKDRSWYEREAWRFER